MKEEGNEYKVGDVSTNYQLRLARGNKAKWFKLTSLSNQQPSDHEVHSFIGISKKDNSLPSKHVIKNKKADILNAKNYHYSHEELEEWIAIRFEKRLKAGKVS